jgi:TRAP-type C4-dicarboxylate transport system permease small subunit
LRAALYNSLGGSLLGLGFYSSARVYQRYPNVSHKEALMKKIKYCFDHIEVWIGEFMFCVMSLAVACQLISRFVGKPLFFTEEMARYSYIWIVFLCMSLGEKRRDHYTVTVFTMFLKGKAEALLELITDILCALVFLYLFYWSLGYWSFTHVIKTPALEIPMTFISTSLCLGFFLACIRRFGHAVEHLKLIVKGGRE